MSLARPNVIPFAFFAALLFLHAPYWALGGKIWIPVHDYLDSTLGWYAVMNASSAVVGVPNGTLVEGVLGGVPRLSLPSETGIGFWIFRWLGVFGGVIAIKLLTLSSAFWGFFGLSSELRRVWKFSEDEAWLPSATAFAFASLPFWQGGGLCVPGQPLVVLALLWMARGHRLMLSSILLFLVGAFSSLVVTGIFVLIALAVYMLPHLRHKPRVHPAFWLGCMLLGFSYALVESRLIIDFLFGPTFVSHRTEFETALRGASVLAPFGRALKFFVSGQYHAEPAARWISWVSIAGLMGVIVSGRSKAARETAAWLLGSFVFMSLIFGYWKSPTFSLWREQFPLLRMIQWDRFYFLFPFLLHLGLFLVLACLWNVARRTALKGCLVLAVLAQALFAYRIGYVALNRPPSSGGPATWEELVSPSLFKNLASDFPAHATWLTYGIHPSILQVNGLHTADGYLPNYPLEKKHQFYRLAQTEFEQAPKASKKLRGWGNRVYVPTEKIKCGALCTRRRATETDTLRLNVELMKTMRIYGVVSAVRLTRPELGHLREAGRYSGISEESSWDLWVYVPTL